MDSRSNKRPENGNQCPESCSLSIHQNTTQNRSQTGYTGISPPRVSHQAPGISPPRVSHQASDISPRVSHQASGISPRVSRQASGISPRVSHQASVLFELFFRGESGVGPNQTRAKKLSVLPLFDIDVSV
ncbi:UNVERIFIED_CONTAM: hypothetical protein FKN15_027554 [Acipenser sinensis]